MIDEYAYLGFPLEPVEVRQIAFDFTNENDITGFSHDLGTAGWCWFSYLLKRWPKLSVKAVTNLSLQCAAASMKESVMLWFQKFTSVLGQMGINSPEQIWNVDEHGMEHAVKSKRIVGTKNVRQFQKQSHGKPNRTTMVTYMNAAGYALAPLIIHKGKYHNSWRQGCMPGAMVRGSKKVYINKRLFADYGTKLIYHLHAKEKGMWSSWICIILMCSTTVSWKWCMKEISKFLPWILTHRIVHNHWTKIHSVPLRNISTSK